VYGRIRGGGNKDKVCIIEKGKTNKGWGDPNSSYIEEMVGPSKKTDYLKNDVRRTDLEKPT